MPKRRDGGLQCPAEPPRGHSRHGEVYDDDDPLMLGLADLLAKNVAGELDRRASSHRPEQPIARRIHRPSQPRDEDGEFVLPRPGLLIDGKRELTQRIGSGSFGTVYEARQLDLDRLEAIKILHERWMGDAHRGVRARFLEEARVMARMRGPHLVEVHDWGTLPGGLPFFVMERLEGKTLRVRLRERTALSLPEFFDVAAQILEGLCEAHAYGVVHRDVKPENIFLTEHGVKLIDFGLAKSPATPTMSDAAMGTPLYMAPEIITGTAQPDARTDLYAASVVMYELLSGDVPFRRPSISRWALDQAVAHEQPVPLHVQRSEIPADLDALIQAGLAKQLHERPRAANAMLARLLEIRDRWFGVHLHAHPIARGIGLWSP
jgi:eukaryotic-like serine/threonine-protein kinase